MHTTTLLMCAWNTGWYIIPLNCSVYKPINYYYHYYRRVHNIVSDRWRSGFGPDNRGQNAARSGVTVIRRTRNAPERWRENRAGAPKRLADGNE